MTKNSVSIELSTNKRTGTLTLIVTGDKEKVQWSRRDLLSQLSVPVRGFLEQTPFGLVACILQRAFKFKIKSVSPLTFRSLKPS